MIVRGYWPNGTLPPADGHEFGQPPYHDDPRMPCAHCGLSWWANRLDPTRCSRIARQPERERLVHNAPPEDLDFEVDRLVAARRARTLCQTCNSKTISYIVAVGLDGGGRYRMEFCRECTNRETFARVQVLFAWSLWLRVCV